MTDSERIEKLEEQVLALQTALALVLSPEHRKIVDTDDLRKTLKELTRDTDHDQLARMIAMQQQQEAAMRRAELEFQRKHATQQTVGPNTKPFNPFDIIG